MSNTYRIEWQVPDDYDPWEVLSRLPSPISSSMTEIYNYSVEDFGFYLIDNLVDDRVAGHAMKMFVDEALSYTSEVVVRRI
ncbi:MAG: hypothetical protein ACOCTG_06425 [Bacteroidota bacterium]